MKGVNQSVFTLYILITHMMEVTWDVESEKKILKYDLTTENSIIHIFSGIFFLNDFKAGILGVCGGGDEVELIYCQIRLVLIRLTSSMVTKLKRPINYFLGILLKSVKLNIKHHDIPYMLSPTPPPPKNKKKTSQLEDK